MAFERVQCTQGKEEKILFRERAPSQAFKEEVNFSGPIVVHIRHTEQNIVLL